MIPSANRVRPHRWVAAALITLALFLLRPVGLAAPGKSLASPDGELVAGIHVSANASLAWSLQRGNTTLIPTSSLGIEVEGTDLSEPVTLGTSTVEPIDETYPWRGGKSRATNHCNVYHIPVRHITSGTDWELEARVFNDGFAYRYRIPGKGTRTVNGESSSWTLPDHSEVWFQTNTGSYEGNYQKTLAADLPSQVQTDEGPRPVRFGPPLTVALPDGGYLLLTEAHLVNYSGMTLRSPGPAKLVAVFEDDLRGFEVEGEIVSPWRVTVAAPDLNALVNTDILPNLCAPPDPELFSDGVATPWIQPGRALITWCVFGNDGAQWYRQKWFVDRCVALHCEYLLVDGGWFTERWGYLAGGVDPWARLKEICQYATERGVNIMVWHAFPEGRNDGPGLTDPDYRREFFRRCREAGVKGVKIDFFNSESQTTIEAYTDLARLAAEHQMVINFHGANKPTGEVRTWPNEVTREGIREQEYLLWDQLPLEHYTALPFSRMVAGHSDFLPGYVRKKYLKNTTATFQMATAIIAASSFHSWPDHPEDYLASPFLGLVQAMPLVWDETIVLDGSEIGRLAALARRAGNTWYIGVINGQDQPVAWETSLDFLSSRPYIATLYQDAPPHPEGADIETSRELSQEDSIQAQLAPGGGFVAWIKAQPVP